MTDVVTALQEDFKLFLQALCKSEHNLGATFAVTEIHPCPPCARNANAVPSSPER